MLGSTNMLYRVVDSYTHIGVYKNKEEAMGDAVFNFHKKYPNYSIDQIREYEIPTYMIKYVSEK